MISRCCAQIVACCALLLPEPALATPAGCSRSTLLRADVCIEQGRLELRVAEEVRGRLRLRLGAGERIAARAKEKNIGRGYVALPIVVARTAPPSKRLLVVIAKPKKARRRRRRRRRRRAPGFKLKVGWRSKPCAGSCKLFLSTLRGPPPRRAIRSIAYTTIVAGKATNLLLKRKGMRLVPY